MTEIDSGFPLIWDINMYSYYATIYLNTKKKNCRQKGDCMFHWENVGLNPIFMKVLFLLCFWIPVIYSCITNALSKAKSHDSDHDYYEVYDEEYEDW